MIDIKNSPSQVIAKSHAGRDIHLFTRGNGSLPVLMLGGVHGDESEGFLFADRFLNELDSGNLSIPAGVTLYLIPRTNPDGCENLRRTNQRNVDLNRNMPTRDWTGEFQNVKYYPGESSGSEVETKTIVDLLDKIDPGFIISLHSYENPMVNFNGESEDVARAMSEKNGLPAKGDIGYPTPGSLGTYAGLERNLPTITLEILRGQNPEDVWVDHRDGILTALEFYTKYPLPARK